MERGQRGGRIPTPFKSRELNTNHKRQKKLPDLKSIELISRNMLASWKQKEGEPSDTIHSLTFCATGDTKNWHEFPVSIQTLNKKQRRQQQQKKLTHTNKKQTNNRPTSPPPTSPSSSSTTFIFQQKQRAQKPPPRSTHLHTYTPRHRPTHTRTCICPYLYLYVTKKNPISFVCGLTIRKDRRDMWKTLTFLCTQGKSPLAEWAR